MNIEDQFEIPSEIKEEYERYGVLTAIVTKLSILVSLKLISEDQYFSRVEELYTETKIVRDNISNYINTELKENETSD